MDPEAGKASAGNGEIEQWRLLGPTMKHKCNCETFLILIETFPFQKTQFILFCTLRKILDPQFAMVFYMFTVRFRISKIYGY